MRSKDSWEREVIHWLDMSRGVGQIIHLCHKKYYPIPEELHYIQWTFERKAEEVRGQYYDAYDPFSQPGEEAEGSITGGEERSKVGKEGTQKGSKKGEKK